VIWKEIRYGDLKKKSKTGLKRVRGLFMEDQLHVQIPLWGNLETHFD
jgi:hypothetical protein